MSMVCILFVETRHGTSQMRNIQKSVLHIQRRGLRHCLSSAGRHCEGQIRGMSDGSDSRAFFIVFGNNFNRMLLFRNRESAEGRNQFLMSIANKKERNDALRSLTDEELVKSVVSNDENSLLYFFYEKYYSIFEYHIYKIFPYQVDVQALVHEFFLYMYNNNWKMLRTYDSVKAQLNTWVSVVSYRFFMNYKKSKIDSNGRVSICDEWDNKIINYKVEIDNHIKMDIQKAIEALKNDNERILIEKHLLQGADIKDVADELDISVDYAYTVKSRALAHLRDSLKDYRHERI